MSQEDLQEKLQLLDEGSYSLLIMDQRGSVTFSSKKKGICPLIEYLQGSEDSARPAGRIGIDRVIGGAAARLFGLSSVDRVYTRLISKVAADILLEERIPVKAGKLVEAIQSEETQEPCPLEKLSKQIEEDKKFYREVKNRCQ